MADAIFSMGSRVFKNSTSLNEPPHPINCETCDGNLDRTQQGYISRYNPKTRNCECVPDPDFTGTRANCADLANIREESLGNYAQTDDCCCSCDSETIKSDCEARGWRYIRAQGLIDGDLLFGGCKCDCRENLRLNNDSLYIKEVECPTLNGVRVWNEFNCRCECDKLPYFTGCENPYIVGPNCQCVCDPNSIPENGCPEKDNRQGIFSYSACECIYPCAPGLIPYACRQGGPYSETKFGCAEPCSEGEYLTPCNEKGFSRCCPYGSISVDGVCTECAKEAQDCDSPDQFNYKECRCCSDGKIYDYGNNVFNLLNGECVCESLVDVANDTTISVSECVAPRFITDSCECKCPDNKIWGPSQVFPHDFECVDIDDRCPEYDQNGNPVGPVDEFGVALYTRWDTFDRECQCSKGNTDNNICVEFDKFLNTQTCECDCPDGSSRLANPDEPGANFDSLKCVCDENKVVALSQFDDDTRRAPCLTCEEIHGPNVLFTLYADYDTTYSRNRGYCECAPGYVEQKLSDADDVSRRKCVECANYTDNSVWNPETEQCECSPGFEQSFDDLGDFDCVPINMPTPSPS